MYILLLILFSVVTASAEIKIWEIQKTNEPLNTRTWKSLDKPCKIENGVVIENETLSVLMLRNTSEIRIWDKYLGPQRSVSLFVLNPETSAVKSVSLRLEDTDKTEACLSFSDGMTEVSLILGMGARHIEIKPVTNALSIEIHTRANYAVIPGLVSEDKIYEVATNTPVPLVIPAQSVMLELLEGMDSILLLMWTNTPVGTTRTSTIEPVVDEIPPRNVELYSTNRIFALTKVAFIGKSIYLGLLSEPRIWHGVDIRKIPGGTQKQLEWQRPFDAVWRSNFVVSGYDPAEAKAFLKRVSEIGLSKGKEREWAAAFININEQRNPSDPLKVESSYFKVEESAPTPKQDWPCTFSGNATFVTIPVTLPYQNGNVGEKNITLSTQLNLIHIYRLMLVYPLDRTDKTPIEKITVVDVMRQALGIGPCKLDWLEDASLH